MINNAQVEQLRSYCENDFQQTLPALRVGLGLDSVQAVQDFVMAQKPAVVVPRNQLTEFSGQNLQILDLRRTLSNDPAVANSPLNASWMPIRRGQVGSEGLVKVQTDLEIYARPYAKAVIDLFTQVRAEGYRGFHNALSQNGYKHPVLSQTLLGIRRVKVASGLQAIENAADIRISAPGESTALLTSDQMFEHIAGNFPDNVTEVIYNGYPPTQATTPALATINSAGDAELRFFIIRGPEIADKTRAHEYAHIFFGIKTAKEGKIPSTIASTGPTETFAKVIGGIDLGEALFFATCMEAALNFATHADQILSTEDNEAAKLAILTGSLVDPSEYLTSMTGFKPVQSTTVVPFGPFSVAYFYDVVKAASLRPDIENKGITDPEELYKLFS